MGGWRWAMTLMTLLMGLGTAGCFGEPPEARARLSESKREAALLTATLETMEERMLGNQATLKLWTEMKLRHGEVTAIACKNNLAHFDAMVTALDKQEQKARTIKRRRSVATADTSLTSGRRPRPN